MYQVHKWIMTVTVSLMILFISIPVSANNTGLELMQAIRMAQSGDPWLEGSRYTQQALEAEAISSATLPDPTLSLSARNLPTDTFDVGQEPMTQFSVGITQKIPRGRTLELNRERKRELSAREPFLRADREAMVANTVTQLWLDAYMAQESIRLIEQDRFLFEHLSEAAEISYSSALARTRQHDVIRAQLELTRLDDRLTNLRKERDAAKHSLSEWIGLEAISGPLADELPNLEHVAADFKRSTTPLTQQKLFELIKDHPALLAMDQKIDAVETGIDLAKQSYKPEWGLTAQYGYRDSDPFGRERADLVTVGVTFDLPIFTDSRQDKDVSAAIARTGAVKTEKQLMLRQLMASLETSRAQLERLNQRKSLYEQRLLPEMDAQAEASLTAYNNDDGDFAEAVRARIDALNANIELLEIKVERQQIISQINYVLTQGSVPTGNHPYSISGINHD